MTNALLDWRGITDERERYAAYLCSAEWGKLRRLVTERCGKRCERCHVAPFHAVHHLTYIRKYRELPEDLQGVCRGCHDFIHGHSAIDPTRCQRAVWISQLKTAKDYETQRELIRKLTIG